jgi:outer membrane protein TolC
LRIVAEQSVYELKYKPQLNFFANVGLNAVYQPSFDRIGFSTGISLSLTLLDGNQRKLQKKKTEIYLQKNDFEKRNFMTQTEINKHKIKSQIQSHSQRIILAESQLNQYNILLNTYSKELAQGEISVMDYKTLLKDMYAKKHESLQLKMEKQVLINSYNYWNF